MTESLQKEYLSHKRNKECRIPILDHAGAWNKTGYDQSVVGLVKHNQCAHPLLEFGCYDRDLVFERNR